MNTKQTGYVKIGLVVVLAVVFIGVVANSVMTISRPAPPPPPPARGPRVAAPATPAAAQARPANSQAPSAAERLPPATSASDGSQPLAQAEDNLRAWPTLALDEIIAYDPFAISKPADLGAMSNSQQAATPDGKQATPAAGADTAPTTVNANPVLTGRIYAVYQRGGKTTALVGSKTVRPGDQLEGGRIIEVDQGGVVLEVSK